MKKLSKLDLTGKILYLTKDPSLIRLQLKGHKLNRIPKKEELLDNISTDAIIPSAYGYQNAKSNRLGKHLLRGIPGDVIRENSIKKGGFDVLVVGKSFGRGSSREHAQLATSGAGIKLIIAVSVERIFVENCVNHGIPVLQFDTEITQEYLSSKKPIDPEIYLSKLTPLSRMIMETGGLMGFTKARLANALSISSYIIPKRQMTITEKIIAKHANVDYVEPGQQLIVNIDRAFFYELQSTVTAAVIEQAFPAGYQTKFPDKFIAFEDHLALMENKNVSYLRKQQRKFTSKHGITSYQVDPEQGIEGICHSVMVEKHSLPGELILGNDSHTCTLGVNGALAIGKGASEMAAALLTGETIVTVPESIRFNFTGKLNPGVTSKDAILYILSLPEFRNQLMGSGRVFEFGGDGLKTLNHDERTVLTNMSIEGQAFTGIIEPDQITLDYLEKSRNIPVSSLKSQVVYSDLNAQYAAQIEINLNDIGPMVALPGDPQNAIPLLSLDKKIPIDIAYVGSCTGGKLTDLIEVSKVIKGHKVNPNVRFFVQASSRTITEQARKLGLWGTISNSGAVILLPGCGACMGVGPGASETGETMISNTNRNFYGRTGKGQTYLASARVVAASAIKGYICNQ